MPWMKFWVEMKWMGSGDLRGRRVYSTKKPRGQIEITLNI